MRCKTFSGMLAVLRFNEWAKGKILGKDVIIHTIIAHPNPECQYCTLLIAVYYREGSEWDTPEQEPKLTAPVHTEPEPHVKVDEMEVR
jgi:hypothetical protein